MFALKPLSLDSVAGAISKAERYRLLNEPAEAESICHDILEIEPENQQALVMLVLALSDQIAEDAQAFSNALVTAARLRNAYDKAYYSGIVWACGTPFTSGCRRLCNSSNRPSTCEPRVMTIPSCAGTPAFAS
jgi:hypothetical protein